MQGCRRTARSKLRTVLQRNCASGLDAPSMRRARSPRGKRRLSRAASRARARAHRHRRSESAFGRDQKMFDSTIGRASRIRSREAVGDDQMPQTADTLAREYRSPRGSRYVRGALAQRYQSLKAGLLRTARSRPSKCRLRRKGPVRRSPMTSIRGRVPTRKHWPKCVRLYEAAVTTAGNASA